MKMDTNKCRVTAKLLNFRTGASTRSLIIGHLKKDEVVEVIAESVDGLWIKTTFNGSEGWLSKKYLKRIPYIPGPVDDFAWMPIAEKEKGVMELPGNASHPRILEFLATTDLTTRARSRDETNWCSAFVNWCVIQAGYEGTGSALARSWLKWGRKLEIPRRGCIVIFSRGSGYGHVGFYLNETGSDILVLGGNQEDSANKKSEVSEKPYPKSRWLGYRIPG